MNFLLTNDDGVAAEGLWALWRAASRLGSVSVVAPMVERSGAGHSITVWDSLEVRPVEFDGKAAGYAVGGTPADCVRLALRWGLTPRPDVVLSGVNAGANLGVHVLYSGTVAAAREGAMQGVPSVAVSVGGGAGEWAFDVAADMACSALAGYFERISRGEDAPKLMNVNVPSRPPKEIRGVKLAPQCAWAYREGAEQEGDGAWRFTGGNDVDGEAAGTDLAWWRAGYVTVTPLLHDLTDHAWLRRMGVGGPER